MAKYNVLISKILECDPAKFQKVCDSYFRENGYPNIISYGLTINGIKTKKAPLIHIVLIRMEPLLFLSTRLSKGILAAN